MLNVQVYKLKVDEKSRGKLRSDIKTFVFSKLQRDFLCNVSPRLDVRILPLSLFVFR